MRLATFNILHGRSLSDGLVSTARLVEACASLEADVLALQEVDRGQPRSGGVDQAAEVARGVGAQAWRFEPALVGEPGAAWRAATDDDGPGSGPDPGYGVAIVSRLPVAAWHVLRLPASPVRAPVFVPGRGPKWRDRLGGVVVLPDEPRVVLAAEVGPLLVATTHLSFVPGYNLVQLRRLTRKLAGFGRPCVLLGDLNAPAPLPAAVTRWRPLARAGTFPADRPALQIDHVLAHGPVGTPQDVEVRHLDLSDHRALVVELLG